MWMEQLQSWLNIAIVYLIGIVATVTVKILLEKIIFMKKFFEFLGHFFPASLFLIASSSKEACEIIGRNLGGTTTEGFIVLAMFGIMFSGTTILFLSEIVRDYPLHQNKARHTPKKKTY
ncbi:hypothetical protein SRRS_07350 [Sporomusa rhizae]|uniref:hypothetical protein n=1 Tax=Sporomusa rhizae TaxID=357999 RepID=UPI00352B5241